MKSLAETAGSGVPTDGASAPPALRRPHGRMRLPGIIRFLFHFFFELIANLPALLSMRSRYRKAKKNRSGEPLVAWVGDNLDEVNGIALSSRIMLQKLRAAGKQVVLFGVAFNSKPPRSESGGSVILAPGVFSLDQAGYHESEVVVIRLSHFLDFIREFPADVMEFQTPGPVASLCLFAAKIIGIKTLSHYRTDILTYSRLLVDNKPGVWLINTWTTFFTRLAGPVVVPSQAYKEKVEHMGVRPARIHQLPRGVDLENFHPDKAKKGAWAALGLPEDGIRLLYVGRVSREKNLELLAECVPGLFKARPDLSLTLVGDGPFRTALQARLSGHPRVRFTGVVQGERLSSLFASADIFVFPSLTDTFGNSVVEALASGVPCVTSDLGGPCEIVVDGECGLVFHHGREGDLSAKILDLAGDAERLRAFKAKARERALRYAYASVTETFWDFYTRYHQNRL
jgi:glycosyltransferase involved in cell wall biosynthesis